MKLNTYSQGIFSAVILLVVISCSGDPKTEEQKVAPVFVTVGLPETKTVGTIQATGQIESKESAIISTRIMGFVTSIRVKPGDRVQKGQLLATISNTDIQAKRAQAAAMVTEAEAALTDAERDYQRFEALYKQQSASTKEYENATLHFNSIKAKASAAREMQREAEAMLVYTNLTAPFSGVVTSKNINEGSMANPGVPLLAIEKTSGFQVRASVAESEIPYVKQGANAEIEIKSTGKMIKGKVDEVSPSSNLSGGQYLIKISIPDSEKDGLYSGMFVQVRISPSESKVTTDHTLTIPASAMITRDQLSGLYTLGENNTALLRWVKPGKKYGDRIEILSGLTPEEKFILTSEGKLYNGVPVLVK